MIMSNGLSVRVERVQSDMARALSSVFIRSNLSYVHIKRINMTKDLKVARVHVQSLDAVIDDNEMLKILTSKIGVIKRSLRRHINLKYFPSIHFLKDDHEDRVRDVEALFDQIRSENGDQSLVQNSDESE